MRLRKSIALLFLLCLSCVLLAGRVYATPPITPAEMKQYQKDGTIEQRRENVRSLGNEMADPYLTERLNIKLQDKLLNGTAAASTVRTYASTGMPTTGTVKAFALLIDFPDYPHSTTDINSQRSTLQENMFGAGVQANFPYESLRNYYKRSSYDKLNITGDVLDWYTAKNNRTYYDAMDRVTARETLIKEAIEYYETKGHDFSQYDVNGDGRVDSFYVIWTGPSTGWGSNIWTTYQANWHQDTYLIDGKSLTKYVWYSFDSYGMNVQSVMIHETGHLLGLPDYYDLDMFGNSGPNGGVGHLDMMDSNKGDHNAFSKMLLGWIDPTIITSGSQTITLQPSSMAPQAVVIMPNTQDIYSEYFVAEYRKRVGNDADLSYLYELTDGMMIWHVNAALDSNGYDFMYDNSYTDYKLLRLMEADGLEEIERGGFGGNKGDYYLPPKEFGPNTFPNSDGYGGVYTGVNISELSTPGDTMTAKFGFVQDNTAPTVIKTSPTDGDKVGMLNKKVEIQFSTPVYAGDGFGQITIKNAATNEPMQFTAKLYNNSLILSPAADYQFSSAYVVKLPQGALRDSAGNALAQYSFVFATAAQPPALEWMKSYGINGMQEVGSEIIKTADGGYIMAGHGMENYNGYIKIVKIDSTGNVSWEKDFGDDAQRVRILQTKDGGYILAGSINAGNLHPLMIRLDAAGNQIWRHVYYQDVIGTFAEFIFVEETSDGGFAAISNGDFSGTGSQFLKTDKDGNILVEKSICTHIYGVTKASDGYVTVGVDYMYGDYKNAQELMIKLDYNGEKLWTKEYMLGSSNGIAYTVIETSDKGYLMLGIDKSSLMDSYGNLYLIKTDASGNELWHKNYGTYSQISNAYWPIAETSEGNFVFAVEQSDSYNYRYINLLKVSSVGERIWEKSLLGLNNIPNNESAYSFLLTDDGGYMVYGTSYHNADYGDMYIAKLGPDINQVPLGDINRDNIVGIDDLTILSLAYGSSSSAVQWDARADINKDGTVDLLDLSILAAYYIR